MGAAGSRGQEAEFPAAEVCLPAGRSRILTLHSRAVRALPRPVPVSPAAQDEGERPLHLVLYKLTVQAILRDGDGFSVCHQTEL